MNNIDNFECCKFVSTFKADKSDFPKPAKWNLVRDGEDWELSFVVKMEKTFFYEQDHKQQQKTFKVFFSCVDLKKKKNFKYFCFS